MSVWCAFKTTVEYDISKFYPTFPLKLSNVTAAFDKVGGYMFNTVAVAVFGVVGSLFIASLASFAFATMSFPGKKTFFMMVICLMMIPGCLTLVPQFLLYKNLNLNNKLIAILLPQLTVQPIGQVFLLTMVFSALPRDLFNAAEIDGGFSSDRGIYFRKERGRDIVKIYTPHIACRGKSRHIADYSAADRYNAVAAREFVFHHLGKLLKSIYMSLLPHCALLQYWHKILTYYPLMILLS